MLDVFYMDLKHKLKIIMSRRYISFYKVYLRPLPHVKSHGMILNDNWLSCMKFGFNAISKGDATFFMFHTPTNKHHLTYR